MLSCRRMGDAHPIIVDGKKGLGGSDSFILIITVWPFLFFKLNGLLTYQAIKLVTKYGYPFSMLQFELLTTSYLLFSYSS